MAAEPRPFALPISYGATDAVKNSGGYLVNLEAEVAPKDARSPVTLRGSPGIAQFADTGVSPVVAMIDVDGAGYVITRVALWRVFPDGGVHQFATFALEAPASVSSNGIEIIATDGTRTWSYTIQPDEQSRYDNSTAYTDFAVELTNEPNYYPSNTVTFLDQRFIFDRAGTNQLFNTGLLTHDVDAAAFASAETSQDDVEAVSVDHQILHVHGSKTTEFWYDTGVGFMPFERVSGGLAEHGVASPYCIGSMNNNTFALSPEGTVYAYSGYQPRPISTPAIEAELKTRDKSAATAFCYIDGGHFYYQLTADDFTAVYDMSTNLWHVRRSAEFGRHRASCHMFVFDKHLVGDFQSGKIFELSTEYYDEAGEPLIAEIGTGAVSTGGRNLGIGQIELEIDVGFGNANAPDPVIGLEISRDDGKTYGNQRFCKLGAVGEYKRRARWQKNGAAIDPRFRFTLSDPVKRNLSSRAWMMAE
jgi:hypothetical protein